MLRYILAATSMSLVVAGAALAEPQQAAGQGEATGEAHKPKQLFSILHAVSQWSMRLSKMADQRAKSPLVKDYARSMATTNARADERLQRIAQQEGFEIAPPSPQTEEGRSLLERMKAETVLLGSLEGDAFDKEYMTLVTNTQQSLIRVLQANQGVVMNPDVKQFIGDLIDTVQSRLTRAQDVLAKVYGDEI